MFKKSLLLACFVVSALALSVSPADAGVFYRGVAPVRRAALPPYPVARRVATPVVRPAIVAPRVYAPLYGARAYGVPYYAAPIYGGAVYTPGVSVVVGY